MEILSPQLAQAVAAARLALAEAFVLKVGQTVQAVVLGKGGDGLTLLKIGDQTIKAALPEGLPAGTTLQLLVKAAGSTPQLAILMQTPPTGKAGAAAPLVEPRVAAPLPVRVEPLATERSNAAPNGEVRPVVAATASQIESKVVATARAVPEARPSSSEARQLAPEVRPGSPATQVATRSAARESISTPAPVVARAAVPSSAGAGSQGAPAAPEQAPAPSASPGEPRSSGSTPQAEVATARAAVAAPAAGPNVARSGGAPELRSMTPAPASGPARPDPGATAARPVAPAPATTGPIASTAEAPEPELVHPLLVAQAAPRPPATAAELPRVVTVSTAPALVSAPVQVQPPATPQAALSQMLPEALARQDSAGPLLQSLATLVQKPAMLPEPLLRAALGILAQRVVATNGKVQAVELERAVLRSGLALEAGLAKGEAPAPADAKAGLLALRAALTKLLGDPPAVHAPQRDGAPPPLKGLALRAPDREALPPLPDTPRDALRAVHGQTDAALSRLKLMQMASLPDTDPARPAPAALRLELPLLIGQELVMAQLQVSRDGSRREAERKRGWTMRFALNYSATGEVGAEVGLLGKAVNVALWAAEPETAAAMQAGLPELAGALEAVGFKPGALRIRHGVPEGERAPSGQLLDSVS